MTPFKTIIIAIFIIFLVAGTLVFSGILPGWRTKSVGEASTISLWGPWPEAVTRSLTDDFNHRYEKEVTIAYQYHQPEVFESDLIEALASGRGPDAVILTEQLLLRLRNKLYAWPYENYPERTFRDTFASSGEIFLLPEGVAALPLVSDPLVLYYNRPLLASSGIARPASLWTEVVATVPLLARFDDRRNMAQAAIPLGEFGNITHAKDIISLLLLQTGVPIVSLTQTGARTDFFGAGLPGSQAGSGSPSPAVAAVQFFNQFADPLRPSTYAWSRQLPESIDAFAAGRSVYYLGRSSDLGRLRARNPHLDFDVLMVPQRDVAARLTYAQVYGVGVLRQSSRLPAAFRAATLLATDSFAENLSEELSLPPVRRDLLSRGHQNPSMASFYRSGLIARGWADPDAARTKQIFRDLVASSATGQLKTDQAVARAETLLSSLISSGNP